MTTKHNSLEAKGYLIVIEGIEYAGIEATLDRVQGANVWLSMGLREGKNREVKRVLESLGLEVNRLIRISYGPFQLAELGEGALDHEHAALQVAEKSPHWQLIIYPSLAFVAS